MQKIRKRSHHRIASFAIFLPKIQGLFFSITDDKEHIQEAGAGHFILKNDLNDQKWQFIFF